MQLCHASTREQQKIDWGSQWITHHHHGNMEAITYHSCLKQGQSAEAHTVPTTLENKYVGTTGGKKVGSSTSALRLFYRNIVATIWGKNIYCFFMTKFPYTNPGTQTALTSSSTRAIRSHPKEKHYNTTRIVENHKYKYYSTYLGWGQFVPKFFC